MVGHKKIASFMTYKNGQKHTMKRNLSGWLIKSIRINTQEDFTVYFHTLFFSFPFLFSHRNQIHTRSGQLHPYVSENSNSH